MAYRPEPVSPEPADSSQRAVPPVAESSSTPEVSAPMLDVHAPNQAVHTWKDFLVHIAAIAIGLLLAVALEKLAEYVHERALLTEARRELAMEVAENRRILASNLIEAFRIQKELDADLKVIQALRLHAPVGDAKFDYSVVFHATRNGPWQAVQQNGSLTVMPYEELQTLTWFHELLRSVMESMHAFEAALNIGSAIAVSAPPEKLNEHDLNELASKTMEAQGRLMNLRMFLGYEENGLGVLNRQPQSISK